LNDRWRVVYVTVVAFTVLMISLLYLFSRYFSG
jgi:hypothetical protein